MRIWIVNPFDELPGETDVPLRYWSICRTLAANGHDVIWWSSMFSHLHKRRRTQPPAEVDGFSVKLIRARSYKKNISIKRFLNHKDFAHNFYKEASASIKSKALAPPHRILVSLPPLGTTRSALKIRDSVNRLDPLQKCQLIVDIMDAWPESFYQMLPKGFPKAVGSIIFRPLHRSACEAYQEADKICAVGQSYLDLAKNYTSSSIQQKTHLCYHGTDLERFEKRFDTLTDQLVSKPLRIAYLGAMGRGYDLTTVIRLAEKWKSEGRFPAQIHFAGTGDQEDDLKSMSRSLLQDERIVFHGQIGKASITEFLLGSDLALVTNRPASLVACPYKAAEYAAAGLPMISCLGGELERLLKNWNAGSDYKEGDVDSLYIALEKYFRSNSLLKEQSSNARLMSEKVFDRKKTYEEFSSFIVSE